MSRRTLVIAVVALVAFAGAAALVVADGGDEDNSARRAASDRWTALRPALLSRTEVAAARVGRYVYVVGGFERKSGATTAAVERYDIRRNRWRRVRSMPVGLNHPAATSYRGKVYVVGGYTGRGNLRGEVSSLYRYDPAPGPLVTAAGCADEARRARCRSDRGQALRSRWRQHGRRGTRHARDL